MVKTGSRVLMAAAALSCLAGVGSATTYAGESVATGCGCTTATVGRLTSADHSQTVAAQDTRWGVFKAAYAGLVDADRSGNATKKFNCHSFVVNGSDRWANSPDPWKGTTAGCWEGVTTGTAKLGAAHSCLTADNHGKCGEEFKCKNNQHVYGTDMPTAQFNKK